MLVERVLLRNVTDVFLEVVEVWIKRSAIQKSLTACRLELTREHTHKGTLAATARAHHAPQLAAREGKGDSFEPGVAAAETMRHFADLERADDVPLFLDDSFGKIAAQELSDVDPNRVAVLQGICRSYRRLTDHDRAIGFDHLQLADPLVVITEDFQQHVARGSR